MWLPAELRKPAMRTKREKAGYNRVCGSGQRNREEEERWLELKTWLLSGLLLRIQSNG